MKERIMHKIKWAIVFLESFMLLGIPAITAFADEDYGNVNWLTTENNNTFDEATKRAKGIFGSGYGLIMVISAALMVICMIFAGLSYAFGGSRNKDEAKSKIFGVFVGGFLVFGAIGIISLIAGIANGAFSG